MNRLNPLPNGPLRAIAVALAMTVATCLALAQDDDVVARVNGHEITRADVAVAEDMYGPQLDGMPADARLSVLVDTLIEMRLVSEAARAAGVADDERYKRRIAFLEQENLRSLFLEQRVGAAANDEALRALYDQQVLSMPPVSERRLRHILVSGEAEAKEIIEALDGGTAFADLAAQRSLDAMSKEKGGDLGFVAQGQMLPEIEAAAAALEPGDFAREPVQTAFGFHVVAVEEIRNRPAPTFEELAPRIRQSLETTMARRIVGDMRSAAEIEKLVPDVTPPQDDQGHEH